MKDGNFSLNAEFDEIRNMPNESVIAEESVLAVEHEIEASLGMRAGDKGHYVQALLNASTARLQERVERLHNAERILLSLGYERCTASACNCSSYHAAMKDKPA